MRLSAVCLAAWLSALVVGSVANGAYMPAAHLVYLTLICCVRAGAAFVGPVLLIVADKLGGVTLLTSGALLLAGLVVGSTLATFLLFALRQPLLPLTQLSQTLHATCGTFGVTFAAGLLATSRRPGG